MCPALSVCSSLPAKSGVTDEDDLAERVLGEVVIEAQAPVVKEGHQGFSLRHAVAEGAPERAAPVPDLLVLDGGELEERDHAWPQVAIPEHKWATAPSLRVGLSPVRPGLEPTLAARRRPHCIWPRSSRPARRGSPSTGDGGTRARR